MNQPPPYSLLPAVQRDELSLLCCITLNDTNKIRLISTPPEIIQPVRVAIKSICPNREGYFESKYHGAYEFTVGYDDLWTGNGENAVLSRKLLLAILKLMAERGWNLLQSVDITKKGHDKDSLFFEYVPTVDALQVDMFAISFNEVNTIRMIGAPKQILPPIKEAIKKHWNFLSGMGYTQYHDSYQLVLDGEPFRPHGKDTVQLRMMLLQLLATIKARGYRLYASVDTSRKEHSLDTWFFRGVDSARP
ncbi:hypothetical protein BGX26_003384 [Mortierella sp. AD094]|nr:hypothetical protein BGX26_003384 [Mortierella sp. AD094]